MSLPLIRKEAQEHGAVLLVAFVLGACAHLAFLYQGDEEGGRFVALIRYTGFIGVLNALVLANRLLVCEYAARTQLFLETLPVSRRRVFATKWLLGCALTLLATCGAWLANLLWIRRTEVLALRDALGTLASVGLFSLAVWAFAAMAGMLGRYRYVVWLVVLLLSGAAIQLAGVAFGDLPLVRLLGFDVQMARALPSPTAWWQAAAIFAVCTVAGAALALLGSGAMASALSQRMTARERVFVIASLIVFVTVVSTLQPTPVKPPFELSGGEQLRGKHASVGVLQTADVDSVAAQQLAATIVHDVDSLIDALQITAQPSIFVLPQHGLDRHVLQRASLTAADGIVLKIAPDAPRDAVRTLVLHSLLSDTTLGRVLKEDRHVLLDGLSAWWALRGDAAGRERWWLRVASLNRPLRETDLTLWSTTSEQFGECVSLAIAFAVVDTLWERLGEARALALLRRMLARPHDDFRVLFDAAPAALLSEAGVTWAGLAARTEATRSAARERHARLLAERSTLTPQIAVADDPKTGITITTMVQGAARYAVYYQTLYPWTADIGDMARLDVRGERAVVPLSPQRGSRVLAAIEIDDATLDCPVRVLAERVRVP